MDSSEPKRQHNSPAKFSEDYAYLPLRSIKKKNVKELEVYNLETPTGDFLIPPIVHNCKLADKEYELDDSTRWMIKFKKELQVIARVIGKEKVEGAEAWVYTVGVDEDKTQEVD